MKYEFKIKQNTGFNKGIFEEEDEAFKSAVNCSATSVESFLSSYDDVTVTCNPPRIEISCKNGMPLTLEECAQKIKGAFM